MPKHYWGSAAMLQSCNTFYSYIPEHCEHQLAQTRPLLCPSAWCAGAVLRPAWHRIWFLQVVQWKRYLVFIIHCGAESEAWTEALFLLLNIYGRQYKGGMIITSYWVARKTVSERFKNAKLDISCCVPRSYQKMKVNIDIPDFPILLISIWQQDPLWELRKLGF